MNNKEIWKDIKGYEGLYQVSNLGRIKSLCGWNGKEYIARENGLIIRVIDTIDRETLVYMLNNNYTYDDIANQLGIAKGTVFNYIKKFKIRKIYE